MIKQKTVGFELKEKTSKGGVETMSTKEKMKEMTSRNPENHCSYKGILHSNYSENELEYQLNTCMPL